MLADAVVRQWPSLEGQGSCGWLLLVLPAA
jgi:hypothetical protein